MNKPFVAFALAVTLSGFFWMGERSRQSVDQSAIQLGFTESDASSAPTWHCPEWRDDEPGLYPVTLGGKDGPNQNISQLQELLASQFPGQVNITGVVDQNTIGYLNILKSSILGLPHEPYIGNITYNAIIEDICAEQLPFKVREITPNNGPSGTIVTLTGEGFPIRIAPRIKFQYRKDSTYNWGSTWTTIPASQVTVDGVGGLRFAIPNAKQRNEGEFKFKVYAWSSPQRDYERTTQTVSPWRSHFTLYDVTLGSPPPPTPSPTPQQPVVSAVKVTAACGTGWSQGTTLVSIAWPKGVSDYWLDIGQNPKFSQPYWSKNVPRGMTATSAPDGFPGLSFTPGGTYYVRVYYPPASEQTPYRTAPVSFVIPRCQ